MNIWKGAFSPTFVKHHGGTLEDHIEIPQWDLDGNVLTVEFNIVPDDTTYTAEIELEWEQVQDGVDEADVRELVASELKLPKDERAWKLPDGVQPAQRDM